MPTLRGRKAPKFVYMIQSYTKPELMKNSAQRKDRHVEEYKAQLNAQGLTDPTAYLETVFVFPSNDLHHKEQNYSPFDGNRIGGGLADPAYLLKSANIPVLGIPTTGMPAIESADPTEAKKLRETAILDLWRAYGYGLNITLPVIHRRQDGHFYSNGDAQKTYFSDCFKRKELTNPRTNAKYNADLEPSFWGVNEPNPNLPLANFYNDELRLLCDFMTEHEEDYDTLDENSHFLPRNPQRSTSNRFDSDEAFRLQCKQAFLEGKQQALLPIAERAPWYLSRQERQINQSRLRPNLNQQQQQPGQPLQPQQQPFQPELLPTFFHQVNFLSPAKQADILEVLTPNGFEIADTSPQRKTARLPANGDKFEIYTNQLVTDRNNRVVFEGMLAVHKKVHGNFPLPKIDTVAELVDVWREACRAIYPDLGDKIRINGEVFIPRPAARL